MRKPRNAKSKNNGVLGAPFVLVLFLTHSVVSTKVVVSAGSRPINDNERSFKRPDPLRNLKYYNGSYDVRDKHYWASAAFTGVYGYVMAVVWLLCGIGFGVFVMLKRGSYPQPAAHHSDRFYFIMFIFVLLFTLLAIVGTSFALASNENTLKRTRKLKNTILKAGEDARTSIHKVIKTMKKIEDLLSPIDQTTSNALHQTRDKLNKDADSIESFVQKFGHVIDQAIQTSYVSHLVIVTVNLILVIGAIVLLAHWHPGFITIIFLCWILTSLCWGLAGIDFFLLTYVFALGEFLQNPQNNSLSSLLPCMDSSQSEKVLSGIGSTIHNFIGQLYSKVAEVKMSLGLNDELGGILGFVRICDPFSGAPNYTYMPQNCPNDAIRIGDIPNVSSIEFTCNNDTSIEICKTNGKFIPQESFDKAMAFSQSTQDMLDVYPDLQSLVSCSIVKDTFLDIVKNQCRPFRVSIRRLWASILALSIFMVILVSFWVTTTFQEKGRCFGICSIIPISR